LFDDGTAVIMCAAIKRQLGDDLDTFSRNVAMAVNLCRVLEKRPVARFMFFSSAAVYGEEITSLQITRKPPFNQLPSTARRSLPANVCFGKSSGPGVAGDSAPGFDLRSGRSRQLWSERFAKAAVKGGPSRCGAMEPSCASLSSSKMSHGSCIGWCSTNSTVC